MSMGETVPDARRDALGSKTRPTPARTGLEAIHGLTLVVNEAARDPSSPPKRHLFEIRLNGRLLTVHVGRTRDRLKVKNPDSPAMIRARQAEW
jgi:hypothetical protein